MTKTQRRTAAQHVAAGRAASIAATRGSQAIAAMPVLPAGGDARKANDPEAAVRPTGIAALRVAKAIVGTEAALARAVGVSQPAVHHMLTRGKRVPAEWCLAVERATGGRVTRHDLRIDIYPEADTCACMPRRVPADMDQPVP